MGTYRPPHHGYGPPPTQDPYARPGSTSYGQPQPPPPAGLHGYGSPATSAPPSWNGPSGQQYGGNSYTSSQAPLPPPPASAPPTNPSPYGYQIQTVGGQTVAPVLPPRIPQPYNQSTSTPPVSSYQAPPSGSAQPPSSHQRLPSVPSAYHQELSQNAQGWPQHPQYSNQPTTHHYDPPLPPRPGTTQPRPLAEEGRRYSLYAQPPPPQDRHQESHYQGGPPQPPYQNHTHGHSYESQPPPPGPAYASDDQHALTSYQTPGGYVPPPPPPKPQQYGVGPGYGNDSQPPRPASVAQSYGQQYQPPPPSGAAYPGTQPPPPSSQYEHDQSSQYPPYGGQQPPNASTPYQQHPPPGPPPPADQSSQYGHGSQTPVSYSRPGSRPQAAHGYGRPPTSDDQQPVSPLQGRQSISFDRPGSTSNTAPVPSEQAALKPPKTGFTFSSDWEHFSSGADEIDDTAMYGVKKDETDVKMASVELPASSPQHGRAGSEVSAPESFHPSPATAPAVHHGPQQGHTPDLYAPTPPTGYPTPQPGPPLHAQQQQSMPADEADYIPPMPDTPPAARRPQRTSIVIGGSAQSQTPPPAAPSFAMESGAYQNQQLGGYAMQQTAQASSKPTTPQPQSHSQSQGPPGPSGIVRGDGSWSQGQVSHGNVVPSTAPLAPAADPTQLRRAQQEAEDYKAELGHLQQELLNIRSSIASKDAIIAQRDSVIAQKDVSLAQKDTEIAGRTTEFSQLKTQLDEITETFGALRTSTAGLETELKDAQAGQADLKTKLEQADAAKNDVNTRLEQSGAALAALAAVSAKHESDKKSAEEKLKQVEAKNTTSANELKEVQAKLDSSATEIAELKKQLEEEKAKATAKAAEPVDIAPGLDAWFKGSLERCKDMLYTESKPIPVQEKLQVFMDFVNAEARLRGFELPFGPKGEVKGFGAPQSSAPVQNREVSKPDRPRVMPPKESDGFVMVDSEADVLYSPGGRPILNAKASEEYSPGGRPILNKTRTTPVPAAAPPRPEKTPSVDHIQTTVPKPMYQAFRVDTPGANAPSKASASIQTPSIPPKPVYKPFTWNPNDPFATTSGAQAPPAESTPIHTSQEPVYKPLYKPSPAAGGTPAVETPKQMPSSADILFDPIPGGAKPRSRTDTLKGPQDTAMLPMPLKPRTPAPPVSTSSANNAVAELPVAISPKVEKPRVAQKASNIEQLSSLVKGASKRQPSKRIEELSKALDAVQIDYSFTKTIAKSFEDKAAVTRSRLAKERAHRQAEIEKRNNELFDNGEIGYGDLETLEGQAKEDELRSKAEEDSQEYNEYQKEVFDVVYKRCHEDIGSLVNLQSDVEALLRNAGAGENVVSADGTSENLSQSLQLLLKIHDKLDLVHGEATKVIQERDRKFKLTQTKPLYAAGDIAAMKRVEKACEEAEKKSEVRARVERAERCKRLHRIVDTEMERGAGENEDFAADVIAASEDTVATFKEGEKDQTLVLLSDATKAISLVYEDTLFLMQSFSQIDAQLNECEYEVSLASARLKGDPKEYFDRLENEKKREDGKLKVDEEKRSAAVKDHQREAEGLLKGLVEKAKEGAEERDARDRKERALEEARRRNGER